MTNSYESADRQDDSIKAELDSLTYLENTDELPPTLLALLKELNVGYFISSFNGTTLSGEPAQNLLSILNGRDIAGNLFAYAVRNGVVAQGTTYEDFAARHLVEIVDERSGSTKYYFDLQTGKRIK